MLTILAVREVSHCARSSVCNSMGDALLPFDNPRPPTVPCSCTAKAGESCQPEFDTKIIDFYIFIFINNFLNVQTIKNLTYIKNSHHTLPLEKLRPRTGTAVVAIPA